MRRLVVKLGLVLVVGAALGAGGAARADEGLAKATAWTPERAAHLLRRAGFGGSEADVKRLFELGLDGAVDSLVDYERAASGGAGFITHTLPEQRERRAALRDMDSEERKELQEKLRVLSRAQLVEFRAWWVRRMATTPRPFEEKMTLFWHGHFTTGAQEVKFSRPIVEQNAMMRELATSKFGELLHRICRDPAMLLYLDSASNRKEEPNENFARELLELFTLGEGHYTERDIKEAARAFTGNSVEPEGFVFRRRWHDAGEKTFLGKKGAFDGDDIADIILEQPRTAEYLAERLVRFFVSTDVPPGLVRPVAGKLRASGYDVKEAMRALLKSEAFYAPSVMLNQVKSPAELVVGTVIALGIPAERCDWWGMATLMGEMGQELYQPPNVKGWDGGKAWISAATLVKRQDFAVAVVDGLPERAMERRRERVAELSHIKAEVSGMMDSESLEFAPDQVPLTRQEKYDSAALLAGKSEWRAEEVVDRVVRLLPGGKVSEETRRLLVAEAGGAEKTFEAGSRDAARVVSRLLQVVMTLPEYQVS